MAGTSLKTCLARMTLPQDRHRRRSSFLRTVACCRANTLSQPTKKVTEFRLLSNNRRQFDTIGFSSRCFTFRTIWVLCFHHIVLKKTPKTLLITAYQILQTHTYLSYVNLTPFYAFYLLGYLYLFLYFTLSI